MSARQPIPKKILDAPTLIQGLELYYFAFFDLLTSREMGMGGCGAITWQTVNDYAIFHQFSEEQRSDLHHHIVQMDTVYMKWVAEQQKKKG
jgi:hypothetical protein